MTLVTATQYDGPICCSVDVVGMSNLATFLEHTSGYRQDLRRVEYGDERDSTLRAWMERTAPLNNVDKVTKPLFIVQHIPSGEPGSFLRSGSTEEDALDRPGAPGAA